MLKSAEVEIKKENQVLMVNKTTSFKKQGKPNKGNFKKGGKKVAPPPEKPKAGPKPETVCYCQGKGHWKRNCTKYLADLKSGHVKKKELDEVDEPSLIDQSAVPEEVPVQPAPIGEEANDDDHENSNKEATEPRRSTRERTTPDWYDPCLNVMIVDDNDEDPATYEEAMMSPDSNKWQEAMKSKWDHMDVKTAFLNGDIEEELYMVQPKGFVDSKNADKVRRSMSAAFCERKHYTSKNVLAAVDFDMRLTYVLAVWEGSAHDASILAGSLSRPSGLQILEGKFYLGDAE
ncbi:hypothetical protein QYE76_039678 [Lolium multiflorum]|uniref:Uncharacterized protein n=1 Tax=Lolium multiflorum TaxID=4521 RepID=A0AAD8T9T1_LOLMU|nr:hypothetical protein QYE76_039678 [Lolium multiflorum]